MIITTNIRLATVLCCVVVSACAGKRAPQVFPSLDTARSAYDAASHNLDVVKHASAELDIAEHLLNEADRNLQGKPDSELIKHLAYVAQQRVQIAELVAAREADKEDLREILLVRQSVAMDLQQAELKKALDEAHQLQRQMAELEAQSTKRGMVMTLGDVLFKLDEYHLVPEATQKIKNIASFMLEHPDRHAIIEGHADDSGSAEYNRDLSRERAFTVLESLIKEGVPESQLSVQGYGESMPVSNNDTEQGRQQNRRVEIVFPATEIDDAPVE